MCSRADERLRMVPASCMHQLYTTESGHEVLANYRLQIIDNRLYWMQ